MVRKIIVSMLMLGACAFLILGCQQGVLGISISGADEVSLGTTAKYVAVIAPSNASYDKVEWQIVEGQSHAEIDEEGNLTPKSVGDVTLEASAGGKSKQKQIKIVPAGPTFYMISFNTMGGNELSPKLYEEGAPIGDLPVPEREGWVFDGWYLDKEYEQELSGQAMPAEELMLFAKWLPNEQDYFDLFISAQSFTKQSMPHLSTVYPSYYQNTIVKTIDTDVLGGPTKFFETTYDVTLGITAKQGFTLNWNVEPQTAMTDRRQLLDYSYNYFFLVVTNGSSTNRYLVVIYVLQDYTYSYYDMPYEYLQTQVGEHTPVAEQRVIEGKTAAGYTLSSPIMPFDTWATHQGISFDMTEPASGDQKLYAKFAPVEVQAQLNGGSLNGQKLTIVPYQSGDVPIPTKQGYHFLGWYEDSNPIVYANNKAVQFLTTERTFTTLQAVWAKGEVEYTLVGGTYTAHASYGFAPEAEIVSQYCGVAVTSIGQEAFKHCTNLAALYIPQSIVVIGVNAFYGCTALTLFVEGYTQPQTAWSSGWNGTLLPVVWDYKNNNVASDGSIYHVENHVRYELRANGNVYLPNQSKSITHAIILPQIRINDTNYTVTTIEKYAFRDCKQLLTLEVPQTVTFISPSSFEGCSSLRDVTLPYVGDALQSSGITSVFGVIFGYTSTTSSTQVSGAIYQYSNSSNYYHYFIPTSLRSVTITSVGTINDRAFYGCNMLTSVQLGDSVTGISNYAFTLCDKLVSINAPSVTAIGGYAFSGCYALSSVEFSDSLSNIGIQAFFRTYALEQISLPTSLNVLGTSAFESSGLKQIELDVDTISDSAFRNCTALTSVVVRSAVTISRNAFENCTSLQSIKLPQARISYINTQAFLNCTSLTSIYIPQSVIEIHTKAFLGNSALTIYAEAASKPNNWVSGWNYDSVPVVWNYKNNDVASDGYVYVVQEDIRYALDTSNNEAYVVTQGSCLQVADIASTIEYDSQDYSVVSIKNQAFKACKDLISVSISASVVRIEQHAFYALDLYELFIPSTVLVMGENAIYDCPVVTIYVEADTKPVAWNNNWTNVSAIVWNSLSNDKTIDEEIFVVHEGVRYMIDTENECAVVVRQRTSTQSIVIASQIVYKGTTYPVQVIGTAAFFKCTQLTYVSLPDSITTIQPSAFYGCNSLEYIKLPAKLTTIGEYAFYNCTQLKSIVLPSAKVILDSYAFSNCTALTIYAPHADATGWKTGYNGSSRPILWNCVLDEEGNVVSMKKAISYATASGGINAPYKEGYEFLGWSLEEGATTATFTAAQSNSITKNDIVYAVWQEIELPETDEGEDNSTN